MKNQSAKNISDFLKTLSLESKSPRSPSNAIFTILKLIFIKCFWRKAQLLSEQQQKQPSLSNRGKTAGLCSFSYTLRHESGNSLIVSKVSKGKQALPFGHIKTMPYFSFFEQRQAWNHMNTNQDK